MSVQENRDGSSSSQWPLFWKVLRSVCIPIIIPWAIYQNIGKKRQKCQRASLSGKVVVITGASSGLGEALAHSFYCCGCRVVIAARRKDELERVRNSLMRTHPTVPTHPPVVIPMDLSDLNSLPEAVEQILKIFGHIDILINNGGISYRGDIVSTSIDVDIKIMLVNYFGTVALTKAVLPSMIERRLGHIVCISSIQGRLAIPYRSAYAASKHALQAFCDTLRAEVKEHDVAVTVISPGYINTSLSINALTGSGKQYGLMDPTTSSGYSAKDVAEEVVSAVVKNCHEVVLAPVVPKLAIVLRCIWPSMFFWLMGRRALKSQQA